MQSVYNALYRSGNLWGDGLAGAQSAPDNAFSKIFGSTLDALKGAGGASDVLDQLRRRFPGMSIKEADVGAGVEGAKQHYEKEDDASDQVAVSSSVLAGMFGDSNLAKMVEDAIAGFLDRGSGGNLMNINGAVVQRTVTITYTQVRYGEFHRDADSGELLGASDLKTNFHEQLAELIKKFFGGADAQTTTADASEDKTDAASGTAPLADVFRNAGASVSMWSLEIYYSASYISSFQPGNGSGSGAAQAGMQSWQYQFASSSASFQGMLGNAIPSAIQGATGSGGDNPFAFLEDLLADFGLLGGSYRGSEDGFFLKLREGRNLMAELMELYGGRITGKPADDYAADPAAEAAAAVSEEAVAAV